MESRRVFFVAHLFGPRKFHWFFRVQPLVPGGIGSKKHTLAHIFCVPCFLLGKLIFIACWSQVHVVGLYVHYSGVRGAKIHQDFEHNYFFGALLLLPLQHVTSFEPFILLVCSVQCVEIFLPLSWGLWPGILEIGWSTWTAAESIAISRRFWNSRNRYQAEVLELILSHSAND